MTEPLAHRYSSLSAQRELSNEYHDDRVYMGFKNLLRPEMERLESLCLYFWLYSQQEQPILGSGNTLIRWIRQHTQSIVNKGLNEKV